MKQRIFPVIFLLAFFSFSEYRTASYAQSPTDAVIESGNFSLFIWKLPVGNETYTITRSGKSTIVRSHFEYTYTQKKASLTATLTLQRGLRPQRYEINGTSFLGDQIERIVQIVGPEVTIKQGAASRRIRFAGPFFTVQTPFPLAIQMMLVRHWNQLQVKREIQTHSGSSVNIEYGGRDTIVVRGQEHRLDCYSVSGLTWGRTWLWFDDQKRLVGAVTPNRDTSSQLQAIRDGFEAALPEFQTRAAQRGMSQLAKQAARWRVPQKKTIALVGGTLVDGTGSPPLTDSVVIVQDGKILRVGREGQTRIPRDATRVSVRGKTVLPGMWDMHAHLRQAEWGPVYLAAGITTVRDVGNDLEFITAMRKAISAGAGVGPRILLAGFIDATDPTSVAGYQANTPEEGKALVRVYKWAGFEQIKVWNNVKPDVLAAIISEAHRLGLTVTGHVSGAEKGIMSAPQAVEAGQDQINHVAFIVISLPNGRIESAETRTALQFFKERGTVVEPTLSVMELLTHSREVPVSTFEPGIDKAPQDVAAALNRLGVPAAQAAGARSFFTVALETVGYLHRIGVPIIAGTDQVVPGHSLYRELELYVKAGFTPMEAIQAATIVPARVMKLEKESGTVEVGKRADLIITERNPLENISNIRTVQFVVANGQLLRSSNLWQLGGFRP